MADEPEDLEDADELLLGDRKKLVVVSHVDLYRQPNQRHYLNN